MTNPTSVDEQQRGTRHPHTRRAFLAGGPGGLLALGGGTAWALDRFVIEHVEATNTSANSSSTVTSATEATNGAFSVDKYSSDTAKIAITRHTSGAGSDTITWFVADITVTDATIVRSAFADDEFGQNIIAYPSAIAAQSGAVLAILAGAEVLTHPVNRGKGAALRTGFAHIRAHHPGEPVVCADSDGQHTLLDILRVAAAIDDEVDMVLGVRRFTGRVPLRSRVGNLFTAGLFALVTGHWIADTQTGLRGYPHRQLDWLADVPGDRFEYELNRWPTSS